MANIITYQTVTPASTDLVLGNYMNADGISETKTFTVASIAASGGGGSSVTSLTTSGTSGVATLSSGVLNIPNYTEEVQHQQKLVTLSAAQIISLNGTSSLELIPAPGAGKIIVVSEVLFFLDYGGVAYNFSGGGGGGVTISYDTGIVGPFSLTNILNRTADFYINPAFDYLYPEVNKALTLRNTGATVTAGNSLVKFNIVYRILDATTLA